MVTDNAGDLFIQIVHFKEKSSGEGKGKVVNADVKALNTYVPTSTDSIVINKLQFKPVPNVSNWSVPNSNHNTAIDGKAKRTSQQIIHLVLHETGADSGDGYAMPYTAHMCVRADASVLQFNDLMELEYHGNNFNNSSIGIEFVNRSWLSGPKASDSEFPAYSYDHEAIPSKETGLTAAQKEKFKEANGYLWCFWGRGLNIYRLPQSTDQLEREVQLVEWLTIDLPKAMKAWTDGGGWLSGKPELITLAIWMSMPVVPVINEPKLDIFSIANNWLQVVSYNDVKDLWTFKSTDVPVDNRQYFCFTTAYDYLTPEKMSSTSGILSHNSFYAGHSDGSFQTLYTWLRLAKGKDAANAFAVAKDLMKNKHIEVSLKTDPNNKKIILLDLSLV
jgi:hypothetical protein